MPSKVQLYAQMADRTAEQITGSYQKWTAFLTTAARLYKYPYNEQLMIYMQRPEATACAEYDFWNEKMGRYVRRGSTGIALIDERCRGCRGNGRASIPQQAEKRRSRTAPQGRFCRKRRNYAPAWRSRCRYARLSDFFSIFDFNTPRTVAALGTAVSEINEQVLRQIEVTIRNYEREHSAERTAEHGEQPDLHDERRLHDSRPEDRGAGASGT